MDKRVEIHGTSRADMNGKRGVATDFHPMDTSDPMTWRYTVKLDGGEAFKLKLANVRAEEAGDGDGGGGAGTGKKKGKGKKGRGSNLASAAVGHGAWSLGGGDRDSRQTVRVIGGVQHDSMISGQQMIE